MTEAEVKLWMKIRRKQINNVQFYRQKPLGKYIIDFYCPVKKLVIEVDGGQHYEEDCMQKDEERDEYLKKVLKLKVIRFTNLDILKNIEGVVDEIIKETR
jgi:very-short-patch-repair endonuclease